MTILYHNNDFPSIILAKKNHTIIAGSLAL